MKQYNVKYGPAYGFIAVYALILYSLISTLVQAILNSKPIDSDFSSVWSFTVYFIVVLLIGLYVSLKSIKKSANVSFDGENLIFTINSVIGQREYSIPLAHISKIYIHKESVNYIPYKATIKYKLPNDEIKNLLVVRSVFGGYVPGNEIEQLCSFMQDCKYKTSILLS